MIDAEWQASEDPRPMFGVVKDLATERKMRLFVLTCCRSIECYVMKHDKWYHRAVTALENRIEGTVTEEDLQKALWDASGELYGETRHPGDTLGHVVYHASGVFALFHRGEWEGLATAASKVPAYDALKRSGNPDLARIVALWTSKEHRFSETQWLRDAEEVESLPEFLSAFGIEQAHQANFLRDIFGNPFRPVSFSPRWRTDISLALAHQMYKSRNFDAMPILADALQDAGCDSDDILAHCRGPGPHVRGCWVVDLVRSVG